MSASSFVLASFPSPDRGVWQLGPIPIRAYALCIIAGIIVAIWWGERRFVARGGASGTVIDVAVWAVPFGLVGGRLYHVATDYHRYFAEGRNPVDALRIWDGGLGIWGAIALGAVGAWIGCRRRGVPLPAYADAIAPGIVVAQAIGRVGNYFNQELFGGHTDLPWAMEVYKRVDPNNPTIEDPLNGVAIDHIPLPESPVHPTFLYELLWNLAIAALVVWADRRFRLGHGRAFALYVAGYTAGRFWIELMRTDEARLVFGVRINAWVSVLVFLGAVLYFIWARRLGEREDLAALRAGPVPEPDEEAAADEAEAEDEGEPEEGEGEPEAEKEPAAEPEEEPAKEKAESESETEEEPASVPASSSQSDDTEKQSPKPDSTG